MLGLFGILLGLALLMWLAYRGWSVPLLPPPARWWPRPSRASLCWRTEAQTFMGAAADFVARFFPIFLLGALFGELMDDSGAVIGAGTLDALPHNGAVVTLLAVCGSTHHESYFDVVMVGIVGAVIGLVAVIAPGSVVGNF